MLTGFVTFEGIDGSGKTTVSRQVADLLRRRRHTVFLTGEPTTGWLGGVVRRAVEEDVGPLAESFLFLADRAVHVTEIQAHLAGGEVVICDRYADSTYAYQGARLEGVVRDPIQFLRRASEWVLPPDLTFLLRVPPEIGMERIGGRAKRARFEDLSFLKKVAENYERLAGSPRYVVVDGTRPADAVAANAVDVIEKRLKPRRES